MRTRIFLVFSSLVIALIPLRAQSPMPVIVPAVSSPTAATAVAAPENSGSGAAILMALKQIKAANEETLKKQAATLEQLDEIEKAADQIKIFSKRG